MHLDKDFTVIDETTLQIKKKFKYIGEHKEIA